MMEFDTLGVLSFGGGEGGGKKEQFGEGSKE